MHQHPKIRPQHRQTHATLKLTFAVALGAIAFVAVFAVGFMGFTYAAVKYPCKLSLAPLEEHPLRRIERLHKPREIKEACGVLATAQAFAPQAKSEQEQAAIQQITSRPRQEAIETLEFLLKIGSREGQLYALFELQKLDDRRFRLALARFQDKEERVRYQALGGVVRSTSLRELLFQLGYDRPYWRIEIDPNWEMCE